MVTFSSTRGWHISLPKAKHSNLGEKSNEANFKGSAFNFDRLHKHSGAFQIKILQSVATIKSP